MAVAHLSLLSLANFPQNKAKGEKFLYQKVEDQCQKDKVGRNPNDRPWHQNQITPS